MGISDRITGTIENWSTAWADRLKKWLATVLGFGVNVVMESVEKSFRPFLKPFIDRINATGKVPPELQGILNEISDPTSQVGALFGNAAGNALVGGAVGKLLDSVLLPIAYALNSVTKNVELGVSQQVSLWLRKLWSEDTLKERLSWQGLDEEAVKHLQELSQVRLSPDSVMRLWIRDKNKYEKLWTDLADSGISAERIEYFKELAWAVPTPGEVINFAAKEAFEDDMAEIYGLDEEFDAIDQSWMDKAGVKEEARPLYWRAHWQHPSLQKVFDLLHRGQITEEEMYRYYRLVEVPPYWRDKLTEISWDLPNRIELRMMARYGLVDKAFLVEQLGKVGLHEDFRDIAADMMLAMGIRTDLSTRYRNGWIDRATVASDLAASGLSEAVQTRMFEWIVKNVSEDRVAKEKDLTKTEIYKAIKKGAMLPSDGVELLQDMGYDREEAELLIEINVGVLAGSPENYQELKKITQMYRRAIGLDSNIPSEDLIQAERDVKEAEKALKTAEEMEDKPTDMAELKAAVDDTRIRYHQLLRQPEEKS
ncbi:hypothetical protein LCGC14_1812870 [marine sediment metagenome]|uniref:Uncharacterized protein n=1 Tax=marine sediment metagenome TaxID=412755 RepID=A0A0F9GL14_9ZZZZ